LKSQKYLESLSEKQMYAFMLHICSVTHARLLRGGRREGEWRGGSIPDLGCTTVQIQLTSETAPKLYSWLRSWPHSWQLSRTRQVQTHLLARKRKRKLPTCKPSTAAPLSRCPKDPDGNDAEKRGSAGERRKDGRRKETTSDKWNSKEGIKNEIDGCPLPAQEVSSQQQKNNCR
jgi:hypothetical protein